MAGYIQEYDLNKITVIRDTFRGTYLFFISKISRFQKHEYMALHFFFLFIKDEVNRGHCKVQNLFAKKWIAIGCYIFNLKQIFFVKMIIVCLEFELGKQSGVFRLCGSLNDSDHVYHLQETTALLYPKSFHIGIQESCNELQ